MGCLHLYKKREKIANFVFIFVQEDTKFWNFHEGEKYTYFLQVTLKFGGFCLVQGASTP
jgi:hypothetical protein